MAIDYIKALKLTLEQTTTKLVAAEAKLAGASVNGDGGKEVETGTGTGTGDTTPVESTSTAPETNGSLST